MGLRRYRITSAVVVAVTVAVVATGAGAGRGSGGVTPGPWCGGTLWHLMTLSDADRARVQLDRSPTDIGALGALRAPATVGVRRTTSFQLHTWRLAVVVDRYRIASNGEIVLVLYSIPSDRYMNAYLPNPHCLSKNTRDRKEILAARRTFVDHCPHATAAWQLLGATVDITGVGFWNPSHNTRGALPNGAELRPVTNLDLVAGCGVAAG